MSIRFWFVAFLQCALASASMAQANVGATTEPGAYEVEVWRATAKLDSPEEAYLRRFPNGAFAELARMSLAKTATMLMD